MPQINIDVEDFKSRVQLAKLNLSNLALPSQRLKFLDNASSEVITIMQVDQGLIESIENGNW